MLDGLVSTHPSNDKLERSKLKTGLGFSPVKRSSLLFLSERQKEFYKIEPGLVAKCVDSCKWS
jgi:hypothetical protein